MANAFNCVWSTCFNISALSIDSPTYACAVGDDPRVTWVNVWADPEANAAVRTHNDGNELTPTALVGDRVLVNPSADALRAALDADPA